MRSSSPRYCDECRAPIGRYPEATTPAASNRARKGPGQGGRRGYRSEKRIGRRAAEEHRAVIERRHVPAADDMARKGVQIAERALHVVALENAFAALRAEQQIGGLLQHHHRIALVAAIAQAGLYRELPA